MDWIDQSNPKVEIQQSNKMDLQSKSNQKIWGFFGFFPIHNPILPTSVRDEKVRWERGISDDEMTAALFLFFSKSHRF